MNINKAFDNLDLIEKQIINGIADVVDTQMKKYSNMDEEWQLMMKDYLFNVGLQAVIGRLLDTNVQRNFGYFRMEDEYQ